ncbi:HAD family hydrolase [Flaviramulus aquimarinus]|uniref:HAD family hydrolase n=2 Tax=Flaviramulus aquimarinus TaxID=1170456 RepID=A0ABP9FDQ1_9FLAO
MVMKAKKVVVFDLDDTLYNERDYLKSAYNQIALLISDELSLDQPVVYQYMIELFDGKKNVFEDIIKKYQTSYSIKDFLYLYRNHKPNIKLSKDRLALIKLLHSKGVPMGILTDGRCVQQRNKIEALDIADYFTEIIVSEEFGSEKPNPKNYKYFEKTFGDANYYYIGDNIKKDFVTPNSLNWTTIRVLDNGLNIHKNIDSNFDEKYLAHHNVSDFNQITALLDILN